MAGNPETLETSLVTTTIEAHWEIQYSRFFNYPTSATSLCLKPLPKSKVIRCRGTWISSSSSSTVSLHLLAHHSLPEVVLVVSLLGKIHEEHFISKLNFSWPQVSCFTERPVRGSRVVFASYRDHVGEIQKFAMRFSTPSDSQTFINTLKESLKDARNVELLSSDLGSGISFQSELISSNGVHYRADGGLSYVNPVGNDTPPVQKNYTASMQPSLNYQSMRYTCSEETTLAYDLDGTCATLPPSFTSLLADCCSEGEEEPLSVPEEVDLNSQIVVFSELYSSISLIDFLKK
ncbi:hypothetical protein L1049_027388 [Liquidambar formosana]|uniref:Poor homologous synapsis 1 PH domain-containing protein n=1 Tax=Liquidambar formosana TaxID=63359 RepID=A0AAP0RKL5_LIQFO